jgi:DNA-directed RNA polymerase specialized sigma24 family protein
VKDLSYYPSTHWTQLEESARTPIGRAWFCERYRPVVLAYLRGRFPPHEADDLCQEFFVRIVLGRNLPDRALRGRGRLRGLLHRALKRFIANELRAQSAQKRGAGFVAVALENRMSPLPEIVDAGVCSPDLEFDRAWAFNLLDRALAAVEESCTRRGKLTLFSALRPILDGSGPIRSHAELAKDMGIKPRDVTIALHRLRQMVGVCLFEELSLTVRRSEDLASEWETIRTVLGER